MKKNTYSRREGLSSPFVVTVPGIPAQRGIQDNVGHQNDDDGPTEDPVHNLPNVVIMGSGPNFWGWETG